QHLVARPAIRAGSECHTGGGQGPQAVSAKTCVPPARRDPAKQLWAGADYLPRPECFLRRCHFLQAGTAAEGNSARGCVRLYSASASAPMPKKTAANFTQPPMSGRPPATLST